MRVISAYATGGPNDVVVRPVNEYLSNATGQQFITENKSGANGNIGAVEAANEEMGLPDFKTRAGTCYLSPAKTPRPIIDRINTVINRYLNSPEGQKFWAAQGLEVVPGSPEDFAHIIQDELARWGAVVKAGNIKAE